MGADQSQCKAHIHITDQLSEQGSYNVEWLNKSRIQHFPKLADLQLMQAVFSEFMLK